MVKTRETCFFFANSFYKRTINIIFIIFFWMRKKLYHEDLTFINKKLTAWECIYNRHKTHESAVDSTITLTITNWNQIIIASCSHMNPSYLKRKLGCKINAQNLYIADLDPFGNIYISLEIIHSSEWNLPITATSDVGI